MAESRNDEAPLDLQNSPVIKERIAELIWKSEVKGPITQRTAPRNADLKTPQPRHKRPHLLNKIAKWFHLLIHIVRLDRRLSRMEQAHADLSREQDKLRLSFLRQLEELNRATTGMEQTFARRLSAVKDQSELKIQHLAGLIGQSGPDGGALTDQSTLDQFYADFEDVFRGERADIKHRLEHYLRHILDSGAGKAERPVLDIGCGRGEWLELLRDQGLASYGIDSNEIMVTRCRAFGLDVWSADALGHLHGLPDGQLGAITAFHVVEHLPFDILIAFLDEARRVLAPGGILILETPNPETMKVGATTFFNDPTHRHPIPPQVLQFMVNHRGLERSEILRLHPFTNGLLEADSDDAALLNRVLFGPQDYAVVAYRG